MFAMVYLSGSPLRFSACNFVWLLPWAAIPFAVKVIKNCRMNYDNFELLNRFKVAAVLIYQLSVYLFIVCLVLVSFVI
jgi:hypothetical protein